MTRAAIGLAACILFGCNGIFGIERRPYQPAAGGAGGGAAAAAGGNDDAGAGGVEPEAQGAFVALWQFESLENDQTESAGGAAVPLTVQQGMLSPGPTGNFLLLGGSGSAVANGPVVDAARSFSISVWVRFDALSGWSTVVSQDGRSISSFYLQKRDSGAFGFTTYSGDDPRATPCVSVAAMQPRLGEWYHVVATRDAVTQEQRIYVDGMLSGRATCPGGFQVDGPLVLGRGKWLTPTDWTTGGVDELGVADRVLSPAEIIDLYQRGRPDAHHYLFATFDEVAEGNGDGLHLAHSHDALGWNSIGGDRPFLVPTVGGKSFRDPHVMRDPSGTYHVVWTSTCVPWAKPDCAQDRGFGHATSKDLVTFSEQTFIEVPREKLNAEHFWAPETFYDEASQQYLLSWASPVDVSPAADPHGIYYMLTRDFSTFSDPAPLYAPAGRNLIDATIVQQEGAYLMFLKDEDEGQKNLRALTSSSLFGASAWTDGTSAPLTGSVPAEGPAPLFQDGKLLLFFDAYASQKLGVLRSRSATVSTDVGEWEDISSTLTGTGLRHGSALEVPFAVYRAVALRAAQ